ncbi:hypothetical protein OG884_11070 [Streptosporangium sp. NBC_01755]|uniref:hypothetical protein n=1 Tax=unclassified Streptosporangium TaxID=2632669 RepID=UPI002DD7C987|nr:MULTISPECIES: hypothetical protein [unclassified Streptosporangium]WSA26157.1 hypothetical protein OIE13_35615 [Streptosporangium sp. NBC_01810]WSD02415.1 hypothetical protein OG884_11070 [Streptosporangium sp. NBC_01755]
MFERVSAEASARLNRLAAQVRNALVTAGLPVLAPELAPQLAAGAEVDVDPGDDAAGGVFVSWQVSPRLRDCALRELKYMRTPPEDDAEIAAVRHQGAISRAMMHAMIDVLTSAGFSAADAHEEYRPFALRVLSGPPDGQRPVWDMRESEL